MGKKYKLYYKGKRLNGEKLFQVFTDGNDDSFYKNVKSVHIGFCYEAKKSSISTRPKEIEGERHKKYEKWDLEEEIDKEKYRKIQVYKKLDKKEHIIKNLSELKELVDGLSYRDIEYFSRWLANKLLHLKAKK